MATKKPEVQAKKVVAEKPKATKPVAKKAEKPVVKKPAVKKVNNLVDNSAAVSIPKRISTKGMLNGDVPAPVVAKKTPPWEVAPLPSENVNRSVSFSDPWPAVNLTMKDEYTFPSQEKYSRTVIVPPTTNDALLEQKANAQVPEGKTISFRDLGPIPTAEPTEVKKDSTGGMSFSDFMKR